MVEIQSKNQFLGTFLGFLVCTFLRPMSYVLIFFSIRVFFTDTDDPQDCRGGEGPSFIPLYHFHPLTNIETFICNFACEMTITHFLIATLVFTRLLQYEIYHLIELPFEWLIDDAMFVCLLDELILAFC